ncbi:MAG TPA: YicC/YloC family endoribonuclease [Nitrospiria bacterium]|nr:YicC/YloC family endoribonuclease [Nitrospiria bacterium]
MIKSMTGYGKTGLQIGDFRLDVEVKSVNHRYSEITFQSFPVDFRPLEAKIRKRISSRFARGHFYLSFNLVTRTFEKGTTDAFFDIESAGAFYQALQALKERFHLSEEVNLSHLLMFSEKFVQKTPKINISEIESHFDVILDAALDDLEKMRRAEGAILSDNLVMHLGLIRERLRDVEDKKALFLENYRNRLLKKLEELRLDSGVDHQRVTQEIVLTADRIDISEEMARMSSHIDQFQKMIYGQEPAGRGMDFLLQEMNREINTVASKTGGSSATVSIKQEIEILREQAQNIE